MENPRWWHVAITVLSVVLTVMLIATDTSVWRQVGAQAALVTFVVGWFTIGRLAFSSATAAWVFSGLVIVTVGVAVGFQPYMAIIQCVAYPLLWVISRSLRWAIIANVALATSVGVGFWFSTGDLVQTLVTSVLSVGLSVALGLWITQIADRSHERQRLLDELRATQDRLAAVSRDSGVASERERLAREIHDTIAQDLTGLVLLAQQARRELESGAAGAADERLVLIEDNARTALAETRALVAASAPVSLTTGGLSEALDRLAARFTRETGVTVTVDGHVGALDRDSEVVLLRCAQEALANVRKHAGASGASVTVSTGDQAVLLTVRDDGHGFDPGARTDGFGLSGMRERLALVGGSLEVSSSPAGTLLTATLPRAVTT